ncbi:MAG: hypothetical protein R6U66_09605 [Bacteroidales bacterium]
MKKVTQLFTLLLFAVFIFTACEDDSSTDQMQPEDAKQMLDQMETEMSQDLALMEEAPGMEALSVLMNLSDPFAKKKSTESTVVVDQIYGLISSDKQPLATQSEPFDFASKTGTYTWNIELERWSIEAGNPSDAIKIYFPSSIESTENDAMLKILDVQETSYTDEYQETEYLPTRIEAELYINDEPVAELNMTASYDNDGEPTEMAVSYNLVPFSMELTLTTSATLANIVDSLSYNSEFLMCAKLEVTFTDQTQETPASINGSLTYRDYEVSADADIVAIQQKMENMDPESSEEEFLNTINNEIDAGLYQVSTGDKIVDIELGYVQGDSGQELGVVFVFADGSTENALPYLEGFVSQIETLMTELGLNESDF